MRVIDLPQGGGKTTELVEFMLKPGNEDVLFIAPTMAQAQQVAFAMFRDRGGDPRALHRFISIDNFMTQHWSTDQRVVFDEFDSVLLQLLRRFSARRLRVEAIALSGDHE